MTVEIGLLIAIIGCFVGLAGWLSGRDKRLSKDHEWRGMVNTKLDLAIGIRQDHEELRNTVQRQGKDIVALRHDVDSMKEQMTNYHKND